MKILIIEADDTYTYQWALTGKFKGLAYFQDERMLDFKSKLTKWRETANIHWATNAITSPSLNPKVHYSAHKNPPLSKINPVQIIILKIHFNIMLPSMPRTSNWNPHFSFSNQDVVFASPMRATNPVNLILLHLIILIFGEEYKLWFSTMQFYQASCF
jgi:hypothetical protein